MGVLNLFIFSLFMIQRIQSVYLFISFVVLTLAALLFSRQVWGGAEDSPVHRLFGEQYLYVGIAIMAVVSIAALITLLSIFLFANRKQQLRYVNIAQLGIDLAFLAAVFIPLLAGAAPSLTGWFLAELVVAYVFAFLARRAIIHDEKLVRAADRIR